MHKKSNLKLSQRCVTSGQPEQTTLDTVVWSLPSVSRTDMRTSCLTRQHLCCNASSTAQSTAHNRGSYQTEYKKKKKTQPHTYKQADGRKQFTLCVESDCNFRQKTKLATTTEPSLGCFTNDFTTVCSKATTTPAQSGAAVAGPPDLCHPYQLCDQCLVENQSTAWYKVILNLHIRQRFTGLRGVKQYFTSMVCSHLVCLLQLSLSNPSNVYVSDSNVAPVSD